jgi:hypothetical protein
VGGAHGWVGGGGGEMGEWGQDVCLEAALCWEAGNTY